MAGNKVGKQRRLGIAQIRAGIGGIDSNRHGPPLKLFAIINASILPASTDSLPHANRFPRYPKDQKTAPEGTVLRNSFVAAGLLAILQFDEDLAIATVLAVQRL